MILREAFILVLALAAFASAVGGDLWVVHGWGTGKEGVCTAFAALIGFYVGRYLERRLHRG